MTRRKPNRAWIARHLRDPYVRRAARQGYRSRAAYKLIELDDRERLLRPGACVLDLGAAPGGWTQVGVERVGPTGRVVAVDLLAIVPIEGAITVQGDLREPDVRARMLAALPSTGVDLVISDMAPNLTGIRATDEANAVALVEVAAQIAQEILKPTGTFLVKVFHGTSFDRSLKALRDVFEAVAVRKPAASRSESNETYLLARRRLKRLAATVVTERSPR